MRENAARISVTVVGLGLATVLLAGCPKTPVLAPEAGAGGGSATARGGAAPPAAAAARSTSPSRTAYVATMALKDIHFDVDHSAIRPEAEPVLDANAGWLKAHTEARVLIEGYADERGTAPHNRALAERRARETRDALVARGIEASRINIRTYGEQHPLCTERTDSCWARNRRAHFLVKQ